MTIATNMAGRGTDIKLGEGVGRLGGLHVLATERHESRRIDRQLRGRCARQGDPGSSHFFISLEDDLMRLFGADRIVKMMERMGLEEDQELEHPLLNHSVQSAQKKVEQHNFEIRKRTLEYDDVMNKQREVIYGFRNEIIHATDVRDRLMDIMEEVVVSKVEEIDQGRFQRGEWKVRGLSDWVNLNFPLGIPEAEIVKAAQSGTEAPVPGSLFDGLSPAQFAVCTFISDAVRKAYELKISFENPDALKEVERYTILSAIDQLWQEHLYEMDSLRYSIGLRGYRPARSAHRIQGGSVQDVRRIDGQHQNGDLPQHFPQRLEPDGVREFPAQHAAADVASADQRIWRQHDERGQKAEESDMVSEAADELSKEKPKPKRTGPKVGRNDPCPCGSGKKYKVAAGNRL